MEVICWISGKNFNTFRATKRWKIGHISKCTKLLSRGTHSLTQASEAEHQEKTRTIQAKQEMTLMQHCNISIEVSHVIMGKRKKKSSATHLIKNIKALSVLQEIINKQNSQECGRRHNEKYPPELMTCIGNAWNVKFTLSCHLLIYQHKQSILGFSWMELGDHSAYGMWYMHQMFTSVALSQFIKLSICYIGLRVRLYSKSGHESLWRLESCVLSQTVKEPPEGIRSRFLCLTNMAQWAGSHTMNAPLSPSHSPLASNSTIARSISHAVHTLHLMKSVHCVPACPVIWNQSTVQSKHQYRCRTDSPRWFNFSVFSLFDTWSQSLFIGRGTRWLKSASKSVWWGKLWWKMLTRVIIYMMVSMGIRHKGVTQSHSQLVERLQLGRLHQTPWMIPDLD